MNYDDSTASFDGETEMPVYVLRLFVTGISPTSVRAINNLRPLLDEHLKGRYELEIIDVHQQPELVKIEDVTAVPVLIKTEPGPRRYMVGDMSDTRKVLRGLGLI